MAENDSGNIYTWSSVISSLTWKFSCLFETKLIICWALETLKDHQECAHEIYATPNWFSISNWVQRLRLIEKW